MGEAYTECAICLTTCSKAPAILRCLTRIKLRKSALVLGIWVGTPIGVPVWAAVRRRVASLRLNWRWQRASLALAPSIVALILGLLEFDTAVLYLT
jgi:hypothetical protein